jgi:CheY-like chemotaxis protein
METILVVDDEAQGRALARDILVGAGYRVLEAEDGETALQIAEEHPGTIHLLLTDVVMPGMSGRELAEHITRGRDGTRVLYMSGYTDDAVLRHGVLEQGTAYIQKPFTPDILARRVREVLDGA